MIQLQNQCDSKINIDSEKSLSIIEWVNALVLSKDFGSPERIQAKNDAIKEINKILQNVI